MCCLILEKGCSVLQPPFQRATGHRQDVIGQPATGLAAAVERAGSTGSGRDPVRGQPGTAEPLAKPPVPSATPLGIRAGAGGGRLEATTGGNHPGPSRGAVPG